ncbi:hypothetical protein EDD85DRAFT_954302 [Armillaria nabsnona]|nr:hypothetical protein EDD85DRAFT_954302 [Armillaria nabsnona]
MHGHTCSHVDTISFWNKPFPLYLFLHRDVSSTSTISTETKIFPKSFPGNDNFSSRLVTDLPGEWANSYSLINQRVLYAALTESQWDSALAEAHRVLAPGGWVQSIEGSEISPHTGPYSERIGKILTKLYAHKGLVIDVAKRFPDMLTREGFINVHSETRALPVGAWAGTDGTELRVNLATVYSAMRGPIFGFGLVSSEQEYDDLLNDLTKEWDDRPDVFEDWTVADDMAQVFLCPLDSNNIVSDATLTVKLQSHHPPELGKRLLGSQFTPTCPVHPGTKRL